MMAYAFPEREKLDRMFFTGTYIPPDQYDNLPKGMELAMRWIEDLKGRPEHAGYTEHLQWWVSDAGKLLATIQSGPAVSKLPPMHCVKCNHYNEYVGHEHLVGGKYTCRSCR